MPDWLTHTLAGWITGKTIKMDLGLVVAGSLIPDLIKINLAFLYFGINLQNYLYPFHTPFGSIIIAGIFSLFFKDIKKAFIPLGIGIITHFILDLLLVHVSPGIKLLFPLSWGEWQYPIIRYDDFFITIYAIIIAIIFYVVYNYYKKINIKLKNE